MTKWQSVDSLMTAWQLPDDFIFCVYKSQCPRTDLNKRFLPRPKTTIEWKLIYLGLKSTRIEIPHIGSHYYIDFSKTDFY